MLRPDNPITRAAGEDLSQTNVRDTILLNDAPQPPALASESTAAQSKVTDGLSSRAIAVLSKRYDILGEAGHGSMGSVYKARDRETGEIVALKLLKPEIASDQVMMERFKNELLFARKITHKNVCRVHEFNRIGGIAHTSMEFVEGESLRSVLTRFGGLPVRKALDVAQQICSGLQEAHAQGIVHRDLKPENVMMDAQGNIKIMDFGIARSMEAGTRLTGSMVGTPAYMAPEQVGGKPVDYRTDIYSLGLILYEIFTGTPAFQAENAVAVALKQMREQPTPPHQLEPSVPAAIERAVMKCIEKEPAKRFQSVAELKNAIKGTANTSSRTQPPSAISALDQPIHRAAVALHPLYGSSALSIAQSKRSSSPMAWVLLIAVVGGATYAGWNQPELRQAAQQVITKLKPTAQTAPEGTAGEPLSSDTASNAALRPHATVPLAQHAAPQSASADLTAPADKHAASASGEQPEGTVAVPATKPTAHSASASAEETKESVSAESPSPAVPKRANRPASDDGPLTVPPANDRVPNYVWVGRYEREERAQDVSRRISDLGLPVAVVPRRGLTGQVYVVVSGPFGPDRVTSVVDWLKTQGFAGVHPLSAAPPQNRQKPNIGAVSEP
jgi:serine/threonine protein kinase